MEKYRKIIREKEPIGSDEIRITAAGSVFRYVDYAKSLFDEKQKKKVTIKATGNAISKAVSLAEIIKRSFKGLHQLTLCGSTTIKDHYEPTEEGLDPVTEERVVSFIEITLSLDPLDQSHPGYQPPLDDSVVDEFDLDKARISRGGFRGGRGFRGRFPPRGGFRGGRGRGRGGYGGDYGEGDYGHEDDGYRGRGRGRGRGRPRGRGFRGRRGGFRGGKNE